jgi:hypothetical protein
MEDGTNGVGAPIKTNKREQSLVRLNKTFKSRISSDHGGASSLLESYWAQQKQEAARKAADYHGKRFKGEMDESANK